jgi:hypothetical protein
MLWAGGVCTFITLILIFQVIDRYETKIANLIENQQLVEMELMNRIQRMQKETIERGFALYCPTNGKFAWKDECEGNK